MQSGAPRQIFLSTTFGSNQPYTKSNTMHPRSVNPLHGGGRCCAAHTALKTRRPHLVLRHVTCSTLDEPVDYRAIDANPMNKMIMTLFRRKMAAVVGTDSDKHGYVQHKNHPTHLCSCTGTTPSSTSPVCSTPSTPPRRVRTTPRAPSLSPSSRRGYSPPLWCVSCSFFTAPPC